MKANNKYTHYLDKLKSLQSESDIEYAHIRADSILLEILEAEGFSEIVDAYNKIEKYYA